MSSARWKKPSRRVCSAGWLALCIACGGQSSHPEEVFDPTPPDEVVQQTLLQRVLDHPQVQPFLHLELRQHVPLTVYAVPTLEEGARSLTAGGEPVRMVAESEARIHFTRREPLSGPRTRIRFAIPAEGVVGHVDLELRDYEWHPIDADVVERDSRVQ